MSDKHVIILAEHLEEKYDRILEALADMPKIRTILEILNDHTERLERLEDDMQVVKSVLKSHSHTFNKIQKVLAER